MSNFYLVSGTCWSFVASLRHEGQRCTCRLQAHFDVAGVGLKRPPTPHSARRYVHQLGELGLSVNTSEMDVRVADVRGIAPTEYTCTYYARIPPLPPRSDIGVFAEIAIVPPSS